MEFQDERDAALPRDDEAFGDERIDTSASGDDPAMQPVIEAGGGVAEGFEEAERELIENAEHGEGGYAGVAAFAGSDEEATDVEWGEADGLESTAAAGEPEDEEDTGRP